MKNRLVAISMMAALAVSMTAVLTGCAMGNTAIVAEDAASLNAKLVPGKTTKADVQKLFGEPTEKMTSGGMETWLYMHADTKARSYIPFVGAAMGNNGIDSTNLEIVWNPNGTVARHTLTKHSG
ncbi:outer membrane protein assembly factor BamE [Paracidovorax wautersii]|uniref:SmpA / OmlA family protein n=1 Tax=Paracidovorax wautersii TaxID=1177982 RepID=A0A1I2HVB3_9BURK|nr:outer membrane protein assembly factor BamE [Paracidovorax wautersii]SFF33310.1 SmpA / OmlA family protein [Paracidovorax wautersii]